MMNYTNILIDFLVVFVFIYHLNRTITTTNNRIDGLHERLDQLRDCIMQRYENDIKEIKEILKTNKILDNKMNTKDLSDYLNNALKEPFKKE